MLENGIMGRTKYNLDRALREVGFQRMQVNTEGIAIYYRYLEGEIYIVTAIMTLTGKEYSKELYLHILEQIKENFVQRGFPGPHLLSVIDTYQPDMVKHLCDDSDNHWILDLSSGRLIIYENQSADYLGLKQVIETLLEEESAYGLPIEDGMGWQSQEALGRGPERKRGGNGIGHILLRTFTPVNTAIISLTVIAFLLTELAGISPGNNAVIRKLALSWMMVIEEEEYYRLVTSIFMHSDLGHLFNNMLVLFFIGDNCERAIGKFRYFIIYFGSGIIAGISSISYNMIKDNMIPSIGASGAIFGIVGAMIYILIVNKGRLEDINSRQITMFAIFSLYGGVMNAGIDNVAHIGGFISGFALAMLLYRRPVIK